MKKFIYSLALAGLALAACNEFDDEASKVYPDGPAISVAIEAQGDSAVAYTVTPTSGTHHYVYAFVSGSAEGYTEDDVVSVKSSVVVMGDEAVATTPVKALAPNTEYSIVAVAYNSDDKAGAVAFKSVVTSDGLNPEIKAFAITDTVMVVTFSEAVKIDTTKNFSAAIVTPNGDEAEVAKVNDVVASGKNVSFYVEGARPGVYISVGWEDGAIKDLSGLSAGPLEVGFDEENIYEQCPVGKFTIGVAGISCVGVSGSYADKDAFVLTLKTKAPIYKGYGKTAGTLGVTFSAESESVTSTVKSTAKYVDANTLSVALPASVLEGQFFSLTLDSAAVQDVDGNYNKQLTLIASDTSLLASTVLPLSAALGTFDVSYYLYKEVKAGSKTPHTEEWTIADANLNEDYEYLVTLSGVTLGTYVSTPATANCVYNSLSHRLSISTSVGVGTYKSNDYKVYLLDNDTKGDDVAALEFSKDGVATSVGTDTGYWMVYYYGLGTLDYAMNVSAKRK